MKSYIVLFCCLLLPLWASAAPQVEIETTLGNIEVTLDEKRAPLTVANFIKYVKDGFYNKTIFHRVIPQFVIQGGGYTVDMHEKMARDPVKNESDNGLSNRRGTIAMARLPDPDSAKAQFFINLNDNSALDASANQAKPSGYTVFGTVTRGMDVVQRIADVKTGTRDAMQDVPIQPVIIKKVRLLTP